VFRSQGVDGEFRVKVSGDDGTIWKRPRNQTEAMYLSYQVKIEYQTKRIIAFSHQP
jgi:ribosomal 30S subunit maturation factor RimM